MRRFSGSESTSKPSSMVDPELEEALKLRKAMVEWMRSIGAPFCLRKPMTVFLVPLASASALPSTSLSLLIWSSRTAKNESPMISANSTKTISDCDEGPMSP